MKSIVIIDLKKKTLYYKLANKVDGFGEITNQATMGIIEGQKTSEEVIVRIQLQSYSRLD